jgi:5-methylcytosine-specific restriction endonuclease McrA
VTERGRITIYESVYEGRRRQAMLRGEPVPYQKGICTWCGEAIVLVDPERDYRRASRTRHYGDEFEVGDRDCTRAYLRSYVFSERQLVEQRGDPECVDCGRTSNWWDADHEVPLWAGGGHDPVNIVRRCVPCHREKTKREAGERAALRRKERGIPDPLPAVHPDQAALL